MTTTGDVWDQYDYCNVTEYLHTSEFALVMRKCLLGRCHQYVLDAWSEDAVCCGLQCASYTLKAKFGGCWPKIEPVLREYANDKGCADIQLTGLPQQHGEALVPIIHALYLERQKAMPYSNLNGPHPSLYLFICFCMAFVAVALCRGCQRRERLHMELSLS